MTFCDAQIEAAWRRSARVEYFLKQTPFLI